MHLSRRAVAATTGGLFALAVGQSATSAAIPPTPITGIVRTGCLTQTVSGPGSTAQINAVNNAFDPALHATCLNETVTDTGGGSGAGIASQLNRTAPIGFTDDPENLTVWAQTIAGSGTNASPIHHIPVAIFPVAVIANLPCAGANPVRLSSVSIAKAYDGVYKTWDQALQLDNPASLATACKNQPIKLIARADVSGTTYTFKNYLSKRNPEYVAYEQDALNTTWPAETLGRATVTKFAGTGGVIGNALVPGAGVLGTPNSIGYAAASNVIKAGILPTTSPTRQVAVDTGPRSFSTWTSGSCTTAATAATIPGSTLNNWSQVSFTDPGVGYPICGFTYDLVFQNLKTAVGANHSVAQTVVDFENAALSPAGQGVNLTSNGYDKLPAPALTVAQTGVSLISDN